MGFIKLIHGPMFSGKSDRLVQYANSRVNHCRCLFINNILNTRNFITRSGDKLSREVDYIKVDLLPEVNKILEYDVILIDEGFLYDNITITNEYANIGKEVIIASLQFTSDMEMFTNINKLLPYIDYFEQVLARCSIEGCSNNASFSKYIGTEEKLNEVKIGDSEYIAVCRDHL